MSRGILFFYLIGVLTIVFFSISIFYFTYKKKIEFIRSTLVIFILFSFYLPIAQLLKYYSLHSYIDFAAWGEILNNIIRTGISTSSIQGFFSGQGLNYHWFAAHFTPLIYLFALPFFFFPYNETIIVLNGLLMISSVIPLYKLAVRLGGNKIFGLFAATLLLWYPTFQYIALYEFEMLRFSIPILLWVLYFWEKRQIKWYFFFVVAAIFVREEVGLTIGMFGVYILFVEKERLKGLLTAALGFGGSVLIIKVVMPFFSNAPEFSHIVSGLVDQYGTTLWEIIKNMVLQHGGIESSWLSPIKWANIVMLFIPFLFIPLFAPKPLSSILANVGVGMVSYSLAHTSYMLYYIAPSVPFILYAFIKGWPVFLQWLQRRASRDVGAAAMYAVLAGVIMANVVFGPSPISLQFWFKDIRPAPFRTQNFHFSSYQITQHHKKIVEFINLIPNNTIISTQQFLAPRLFQKKGIMVFPQLESKDGVFRAEYVFLDKTNNGLESQSAAYISETEQNRVRNAPETWGLIRAADGYEL